METSSRRQAPLGSRRRGPGAGRWWRCVRWLRASCRPPRRCA